MQQPQIIPKVIYRTSKTLELSEQQQQAWDLTKLHNPSYTQILYDDGMARDLISKNFDEKVLRVFDMLVPGAAKADLFRYAVIYINGGVYLDDKSGAHDLSKLIRPNDKFIVSTWNAGVTIWGCASIPGFWPFGEMQQWWIISAPRNPVLLRIINRLVDTILQRKSRGDIYKRNQAEVVKNYPEERQRGIPWRSWFGQTSYGADVLHSTGPWLFTSVILESKGTERPRIAMPCGNGVMVYSVGWHWPGGTYSGHGLLIKDDS